MHTQSNLTRIRWDLAQGTDHNAYIHFVRNRPKDTLSTNLLKSGKDLWIEIGAGSGKFFSTLAQHYPHKFLIGIERERFRGNRLAKKTANNFLGIRGNAIAAIIRDLPEHSVERLYILYPCPWPKNRHRLNRWYMHPLMSHLVRVLKPNGFLIWASDQKFYIEEAKFVSETVFPLKTLHVGELSPNPYNDLGLFPEGRSKFESTFLLQQQPCFELISQKA